MTPELRPPKLHPLFAADLYRPAADREEPHPVLLEYLPYRRNESRSRSWDVYRAFTDHGYIVARVDIRGTGSSGGRLPPYEYSDIEQDDAEAVIAWLAEQPWSNGRVGMFGISWGGFNSIHLGRRAPEALGAIVAIGATDDLFLDDVHYIDGLMHVDAYEIHQDLMNAVVSTPELELDGDELVKRFDTEPWLLEKLLHPNDGKFWDRGSLDTDYTALRVPALLFGGWYDGYRDSVPRMLEHCTVPIKAIVGPWTHAFPHDAVPAPDIEWRDIAARWFDYWLQGIDNGVLDEPRFSAFLRRWHAPGPEVGPVAGSWWHGNGWPPSEESKRKLFPAPGGALRLQAEAGRDDLAYQASRGTEAGNWWGDLAPDQAPFDATALTYTSPALDEEIPILGFPRVHLNATATASGANWLVRLSDVASLPGPEPAPPRDPVPNPWQEAVVAASSETQQVRDPTTGVDHHVSESSSTTVYPWGKRERSQRIDHQVDDARPWQPRVDADTRIDYVKGDRVLSWRGRLELTSHPDRGFTYFYRRRLYDNKTLIRDREWRRTLAPSPLPIPER